MGVRKRPGNKATLAHAHQGGHVPPRPFPPPTPIPRGSLGCAPTRQRKLATAPQQGAGGAAPAGGTGGVPLFPKTLEGGVGGIAAQAKPDPSLIEGAGQDKTIRPRQRADPGVRGLRHTPLAKYERVCYSTPMKSATGPLLFLGACRIHEHWGLTTEHPPVAGALREQPKGQDPPRKAGAGANAVVGHRLLGAAFRLPAVSLRLATAPSQICPGSVTAPFEGRLVNVAKRRQLSHSRDICPLECYGLPLSLSPPTAHTTQGATPTGRSAVGSGAGRLSGR